MDPCVALLCKFVAAMTLLAIVGGSIEKAKGGNHTVQNQYIDDAVSVLGQLGYSRLDALDRVRKVISATPNATLDEIVNAAIRL